MHDYLPTHSRPSTKRITPIIFASGSSGLTLVHLPISLLADGNAKRSTVASFFRLCRTAFRRKSTPIYTSKCQQRGHVSPPGCCRSFFDGPGALQHFNCRHGFVINTETTDSKKVPVRYPLQSKKYLGVIIRECEK